jgi:hypothetical protein
VSPLFHLELKSGVVSCTIQTVNIFFLHRYELLSMKQQYARYCMLSLDSSSGYTYWIISAVEHYFIFCQSIRGLVATNCLVCNSQLSAWYLFFKVSVVTGKFWSLCYSLTTTDAMQFTVLNDRLTCNIFGNWTKDRFNRSSLFVLHVVIYAQNCNIVSVLKSFYTKKSKNTLDACIPFLLR